jgi:acetoin utilization protein AcuB
MIVHEWMTPDPVTASPETTLGEAQRLMRERRCRHLPVVEDGRLVGLVSDRDVRSALPSAAGIVAGEAVAAALARPVGQLMSRDLRTIPSRQPVEEAARTLHEARVGALPVVAAGRLVGIITADDLLRAFLHGSGVLRPSSRIELLVPQRPGVLVDALRLLGEGPTDIVSVATMPVPATRYQRVVVRVGTINPNSSVERLAAAGYEVVSPLDELGGAPGAGATGDPDVRSGGRGDAPGAS